MFRLTIISAKIASVEIIANTEVRSKDFNSVHTVIITLLRNKDAIKSYKNYFI